MIKEEPFQNRKLRISILKMSKWNISILLN